MDLFVYDPDSDPWVFLMKKKGGQLGRVSFCLEGFPVMKKTLGWLAVYNSRKPDGKDFQLHYTGSS